MVELRSEVPQVSTWGYRCQLQHPLRGRDALEHTWPDAKAPRVWNRNREAFCTT